MHVHAGPAPDRTRTVTAFGHVPAIALRVVLLCAVAGAPLGAEQAKGRYRARLAPMPLDVSMQNVIAGEGAVTATLAGTTLTISGRFDKLKSPATIARLHAAPRGMRGPSIADITVSPGLKGTVSATLDLTPAQLEDLANSRLYLQLHTEKAPDGTLWGWLLSEDPRR